MQVFELWNEKRALRNKTYTGTWAGSDPRYHPPDRRWSWCPAGSSQGYSDMTQSSGSCSGAAHWTGPAWRCSRCALAPCSSQLQKRRQSEDNVWALQDSISGFHPLPSCHMVPTHFTGSQIKCDHFIQGRFCFPGIWLCLPLHLLLHQSNIHPSIQQLPNEAGGRLWK